MGGIEGHRLTGAASARPGDIAVIDTGGDVAAWIRAGELLTDFRTSQWDHAAIVSRLDRGRLLIVEAEPGGAVERPWHYDGHRVLWSTGILPDCPAAGEAARNYIGTGYSFADYAAIALHHLRVPVPGLQHYIADTGHMICSQLADQARLDAGSHLFADGRWPGYVKPSDIGWLLSA